VNVRLTDEQCEALQAEADAAGVKFFDHCRSKLLANMAIPVRTPPQHRPAARPPAAEDRIGRLEAMMAQLSEAIVKLAHPAVVVEPVSIVQATEVDDLVGDALVQISAEEAGGQPSAFQPLDQPFDRGYPDRSGDGIRHLGPRRPLPLTAGLPRHLAG
jgi:hypothetical protein